MSGLRTNLGDDHPDAALKHLLDAKALLGQNRSDGAAYLSGYVVECALKSLWLHETGIPPGGAMPWGRQGHNIGVLAQHIASLASVAGARTARYYRAATSSILSSAIASWNPEIRYRSPFITISDAQAWCDSAESVFLETIAQMRLDGVI